MRTVTLDDNFRSSKGIVALGREVAARNDPRPAAEEHGRRRAPALRARRHAGADLRLGGRRGGVDLRPDRAAARACRSPTRPGREPRGLSWSDFAVLFRSVSKDAGELVDELRRRSIPYVIKGLTRLFDAPEVQACVACFQYVLHEKSADDVVDAWLARRCRGDPRGAARGGAADPGGGAELAAGRAVGHVQHPADLPAVPRGAGIREETVPPFGWERRPGPRRAASWSSTTSASSARRSPTSSRSTSSPRRRPSTTRS